MAEKILLVFQHENPTSVDLILTNRSSYFQQNFFTYHNRI